MMKAMTTVGAALILSLGGTVAAQETTKPEDQATHPAVPATQHQAQTAKDVKSGLFSQLDQDGDGMVSQQEAEAHSSLSADWSDLDQNRDGRLDSEEFSAYERKTDREGNAAPVGAMGKTEEGLPSTRHQEQTVGDDLVGELDKDGDGEISEQEAQAEAELSDNWDQLDKNRDGKLDSSELRERD
jgi:Ca2+-binding EF-hand superfamily protein